MYVNKICQSLRAGHQKLALQNANQKNIALMAAVNSIEKNRSEILKANSLDVETARKGGMSEALVDRLSLDDKKIDGITDLRDESNREGMRIVIELRRDVNANIVLNKLSYQCLIDNEVVDMTHTQFELLELFIKNPNIALSRDRIIENIWGYDYEADDRTIDAHIKLLRSKLGKYRDSIKTVRKIGYKFEYEENKYQLAINPTQKFVDAKNRLMDFSKLTNTVKGLEYNLTENEKNEKLSCLIVIKSVLLSYAQTNDLLLF